jgi:hypothetical protein
MAWVWLHARGRARRRGAPGHHGRTLQAAHGRIAGGRRAPRHAAGLGLQQDQLRAAVVPAPATRISCEGLLKTEQAGRPCDRHDRMSSARCFSVPCPTLTAGSAALADSALKASAWLL